MPSGLWLLFPLLFGCAKPFMAFKPIMFVATPFWWCESFLKLSGFFCSPTLLFGGAKRFGPWAFLLSLSLLFGDANCFCSP